MTRLGAALGAALVAATMASVARAQPAPAPGTHPGAAALDARLAAGDGAAADAWLSSNAAALATDDRLAFDTIYVLVRRGASDRARATWNQLAARLADQLKATAAAGPAASQADQQRLAEALFAQALLVARDGDREGALRLLGQADAHGFPPLESPLMLLAADTLRGLNEHALAVNAYREYLQRAPADVAARLGLATSLYASRKFDLARVELDDVTRRAPGAAGAQYLLGSVLVELGDYEAARTHLARELAADPTCVGCLSRLAHLAYLEGREAECDSLLAKASALDPADVETRMIAGLLAFRRERYDAAIEHLAFVVERSPGYMAARYQLAMAYRRVGNAQKAAEQLEAYQQLLREQKAREIGIRGQ
jgi:tetratricopeptide (TPR) repeat protein